jgi:hypothetical protein
LERYYVEEELEMETLPSDLDLSKFKPFIVHDTPAYPPEKAFNPLHQNNSNSR